MRRMPLKGLCRLPTLKNRGVALIMALMVFALIAAISATIMTQLARGRDLLSTMQSTAALKQQLLGGEAWARYAFATMDASNLPTVDEAPLILMSQSFNLTGEDDSMQVSIIDRQNCYNLNRLADDESNDEALEETKRLLDNVGLDSELGEQLKDWIDNDQDLSGEGGHEDEFYQALSTPFRTADFKMVAETELALLQLPDETIETLILYFCAWPDDIGMNVNRLSSELLDAMLPDLSSTEESELLAQITTAGFDSVSDFIEHDSLAAYTIEEEDWRVDLAFVDVFVDVTLAGRSMSLHSKLYKANNGVISSYYRAYAPNYKLQSLFGLIDTSTQTDENDL